MKQGNYHLWLMLEKNGDFASILSGTCECVAGWVRVRVRVRVSNVNETLICRWPKTYVMWYMHFCRLSVSCTHVSALLHTLEAVISTEFLQQPSTDPSGDDNECLSCTSYPCQWKQPKKQKESNLQMGDAIFEKHVLGREHKWKW